ncbi:MAG TPA: Uma2 family endonuclease [Urbifossiella sp.]|jgi:Uma2 family endonuclease|nr:Uma2 family endonuclease [Urbifossiella sp.]
MSVLIRDPDLAADVVKARAESDGDRWTEVWDGVIVMPALPNNEHQTLVQRLSVPFSAVINWDTGDVVHPGANVSDREHGWKLSYRIPDILVALAGGRAKDCGTHWCGGPDMVVEVQSPSEDPRDKLPFYAAAGTREVLVIDRDPWCLELFRLDEGVLRSVGRSDETGSPELVSSVLPLGFRLRSESPRSVIVVTHRESRQTWTA